MRRDLRDPLKLGERYLALREGEVPVPIEAAVDAVVIDFDAEHQGPVEKYGRADTVNERYERIRIA